MSALIYSPLGLERPVDRGSMIDNLSVLGR